ncbi:hypothetical protein GCM10023259_008690 [Thermocatellispora tengchongensis]
MAETWSFHPVCSRTGAFAAAAPGAVSGAGPVALLGRVVPAWREAGEMGIGIEGAGVIPSASWLIAFLPAARSSVRDGGGIRSPAGDLVVSSRLRLAGVG